MNSNQDGPISINSTNGDVIINHQDLIHRYQSASRFLALKLYKRYAFNKTTLQDFKLQGGNGHLQLLVPEINGYDWAFTCEFSKLHLKTVALQVVRQSLQEYAAMSKHDFHLYCGLLKANCLEDLQLKDRVFVSWVKFPWGLIEVGKYPDSLTLKLIIHYEYHGELCVNERISDSIEKQTVALSEISDFSRAN